MSLFDAQKFLILSNPNLYIFLLFHVILVPYLWIMRKKARTYQEGLLVLKWAQIKNKAKQNKTKPNSHFYTGVCHANRLHGETYTELPVCTVFLLSEPVLYKGVPGIVFQPLGLRFPHPVGVMQLYPHQHLH